MTFSFVSVTLFLLGMSLFCFVHCLYWVFIYALVRHRGKMQLVSPFNEKIYHTDNKVERCVAMRRINTMSINSHAVRNTTQNSKVLTLPTARRAFFELVLTSGAESDDAAFSAPAVRGNCGATHSAPAVRTKLRWRWRQQPCITVAMRQTPSWPTRHRCVSRLLRRKCESVITVLLTDCNLLN